MTLHTLAIILSVLGTVTLVAGFPVAALFIWLPGNCYLMWQHWYDREVYIWAANSLACVVGIVRGM